MNYFLIERKKGSKSKMIISERNEDNENENQADAELPLKPLQTKKSKKKAKVHYTETAAEIENPEDDSFDNASVVHKSKHKRKRLEGPEPEDIKEELLGVEEEPQISDNISWPQEDLSELIKRMERGIPEKDNLVYSTRVEKLSWDDFAFKEYTGEDCKKTWILIQKRLRRFRLLNELLQDAKEWISKPWTNFYKGNKAKRHPEMPRKPLSMYMIFYLNNKDKILAENPGIEMTEVSKIIAQMYKNLLPSKRSVLLQLAADEKKVYEEKLEEFYRRHPEIPRIADKSNPNRPVDTGPRKPLTPFALYFEEQLKKLPPESDMERSAYKEQCKEEWKNLNDKTKLIWIDWALDKEAKYLEELKTYKSLNPDFSPGVKTILNKEERLLKERLSGKPIKPPNSAYSLFSRMMLQSEEIKKIPSKDRMKAIADQWKNCTEKEKRQYKERAEHMVEQYKLDFASYLESLPEEKRQTELKKNIPKRKKKIASGDSEQPTKKKKKLKLGVKKGENGLEALKIKFEDVFKAEPPQPPESGYVYFCNQYKGDSSPKQIWKTLSKDEQLEYEKQANKLKKQFIVDYEAFLKGLTKEQLTAFSQIRMRKNAVENQDADEESEDSSNSCESSNEQEGSEQLSDEDSD